MYQFLIFALFITFTIFQESKHYTVRRQNIHKLNNPSGGNNFTNCKEATPSQTARRQRFHKLSGGNTFTNCQEAKLSLSVGGNTFHSQVAIPSQPVRRQYLYKLSGGKTFTICRRQYFHSQVAIPSQPVKRHHLGGKTFINYQEATLSQTVRKQYLHKLSGGNTFTIIWKNRYFRNRANLRYKKQQTRFYV